MPQPGRIQQRLSCRCSCSAAGGVAPLRCRGIRRSQPLPSMPLCLLRPLQADGRNDADLHMLPTVQQQECINSTFVHVI